jgi:hypothetical protein
MVFGAIAGVAVFILLKILLNKWTDDIANKTKKKQDEATQEITITENYPLQTPAALTIIRDSSFVAVLVPQIIFLNDVQAASIKNGESATISITMKHNLIRTNTVDINGKSAKGTWYKFEAQDGAKGKIHVNAGIFKPPLNGTIWDQC